MPIYTYRCNCRVLEVTRAIEDRDTPITCDACRSEMKRQLEVASVEFKGTGFYRTDRNA